MYKAGLAKLSLIGIIYFSVVSDFPERRPDSGVAFSDKSQSQAGGPEGTELMILSGGPLLSIAGIVVFTVVFALPISFMTMELSAMYPSNGGFVIWITEAYGKTMGGAAGYIQFISSVVDAALYPNLMVSYVSALVDRPLEDFESTVVSVLLIVFVTVITLTGISSVGHGSVAMMLLIFAPFSIFIIITGTGVFTGVSIAGWNVSPANWVEKVPQVEWHQFVVTLAWNMGMWDTVSVCSGELQDVPREMPVALVSAVFLVSLNYILPIMAFTALDNRFENYTNGYYITVAENVGGIWAARLLGAAQCFSVSGLFIGVAMKNAWMLSGMAESGLLPSCFGWKDRRFGSPSVAILCTQAISVVLAVTGNFEAVIGCDMVLYAVCLMLEITSLFYLRLKAPDANRPYKIPLEEGGLIAMFIPSCIICGAMFASVAWVNIGVCAAIVGGSLVFSYSCGHTTSVECRDDATVSDPLFTDPDDLEMELMDFLPKKSATSDTEHVETPPCAQGAS